ncbi:MAG: hypothetical protein KQH63_20970 [Desulfobulbaceae bacterium]|nr:hypothetical protein [Desulfobulbaceae bacterium]
MIKQAGIKTIFFFGSWLLMATAASFSHASVHDGESIDCKGCHSIEAPDASSLCLSCHAEKFKVLSEDGSLYTPGGDFFWLSKSYLAAGYGSFGDMHGHNVIAAAYHLRKDGLRDVAPSIGNTPYRAEWLSCTSCHDPHLSRSTDERNYRLLAGEGYEGGTKARSFSFQEAAPVAKPLESTRMGWLAEDDANHPEYISGMSEWCTNCHSGYLSDKNLSHPAGAMARLQDLSNTYKQFLQRTKGSQAAAAYDFLVPFEWGEGRSGGDGSGPTFGANVMCVTCHRAHASAFKAIGRWDLKIENGLATSPVLATPEGRHAYYGHSIKERYGDLKKTLCVLCHAVD